MQRCEHPINISESIASVNEVANKISQEAFSGRPVKILNSKNFPIPDVEGTRGTQSKNCILHQCNCTYLFTVGGKFWRTSKIIRAVSLHDFEQIELQRIPPKAKVPAITLSDSDSDVFESPPVAVKRRKTLSLRQSSSGTQSSAEPSWLPKLNEVWDKVSMMSSETTQQLCEVQSLKEMLKKQAQMGMKPITGIFRCMICKSNMSEASNSVIPPCCQAALACRECLQEWLNTSDSQTCPHCREHVDINQCVPMPIIRPLIAALANEEEPGAQLWSPMQD